MKSAIVSGSFDDLRSRDIRFLEEASKFGNLQVLLWPDTVVMHVTGEKPKFSQDERLYMLQAIRCVSKVTVARPEMDTEGLCAGIKLQGQTLVAVQGDDSIELRTYCQERGLAYHVVPEKDLNVFCDYDFSQPIETSPAKKVVVTGCFDWFHSGHVRFLEEVSEYGDLYVIAGNDKNIEYLKGKGHPLFGQNERVYVLQSIRFVKRALISTGMGWMDAEPEILRIKPDIYAVNEDGDKPEKSQFCAKHGLEYLVLKRLPKEGLTRRESTQLRGF